MALVTLALLGAGSASALTIQPGPEGLDAQIHPFGQFGDSPEASFGSYTAVDNMRVFFKFHLDGLPKDLIDSLSQGEGRAIFTIHQRWQFNTPHTIRGSIHRITEAWAESAITETRRTATEVWTVPLGTYDPQIIAQNTWIFGATPQPVNFDITELVRGWTTGNFANYGFIIVPETLKIVGAGSRTNNYGGIFFSDHPNPEWRPKLTITPVPASLPLLAAGVAGLALLRNRSRNLRPRSTRASWGGQE